MGTRCDFYLGRGPAATYLGSLSRDGWAQDLAPSFEGVITVEVFQQRLASLFEDRGHVSARYGWPWPWKDSESTGEVIAFDEGQMWCRHRSNFWAPLTAPDNPSKQSCVFADMIASQQTTPEGRLRLNLRQNTNTLLPVDLPLLPMVAAEVIKLFVGRWFHVQKEDDGYWSPALWGGAARDYDSALTDIANVLATSDDYKDLRLAIRAEEPSRSPLWDILDWVTAHNGHVAVNEVTRTHSATQPYLFGCCIPDAVLHEFGESDTFHHVQDAETFEQMLTLCYGVIDRYPNIYASLVATEANRFGLATSTQASMRGFITVPQEALGNLCVKDLCGSEAGRLRIRQFMAALYYS